MNGIKTIVLAALLAAPAAGCRTPHLGAHTGEVYRAAIEGQRESAAEQPAPLDAADAYGVLARHRGTGPKDGATGGGAGTVTSTSSAGGATGGGLWQGATGNITLEAK